MKRIMVIIIFFCYLHIQESRCQSAPIDFGKVRWLIGTWVNENEKGNIYESWSEKNTSELTGISYLLNGQDTVIKETTRLLFEKDTLFFITTVVNQNDGKPVHFALSMLIDTEMMFENPEHDFPKVIYYRQESEDSLLAEIWTTDAGKIRKISFPMRRSSS